MFEIEKSGIHDADMVITVSNWTRRTVMTHDRIAEGKIQVIHNGIAPREEAEKFLFPDIGSPERHGFFVEVAHRVLEEFGRSFYCRCCWGSSSANN